MKNLFNRLTFNSRLILIICGFTIVFNLVAELFVTSSRNRRLIEEVDVEMTHELDQISDYIRMEFSHKREKLALFKSVYEELVPEARPDDDQDSAYTLTPAGIRRNEMLLRLNESEQQRIFRSMKSMLGNRQYYETGFAFLLDRKGTLLVHPTSEGENYRNASFVKQILNLGSQEGRIEYRWPNDRNGERKVLYFKYVDDLQAYLAITFERENVLAESNYLSGSLIVFLLFNLVLIVILIYFSNRPFIRLIDRITEALRTLSLGRTTEKIAYFRSNELGRIVSSLNALIDGLRQTVEFSREIGRGDLTSDYKLLSDEDTLGLSLLEMRRSLLEAREEERKRKEEDDKRRWVAEGLAQFSNILRQDNNDLEKLSYNIILGVTQYVEAIQGGVFILNDETNENITYDLKASVAYNRRKYVDKRIEQGAGLVGRCAMEKGTIYLKEIPNDYVDITSGLGGATPRTLLLVPLKLEEKVYGIIEIASFNEFAPHQIEFIEKIAENIASTISSVRINLQTNRLLKESEKQAKRLEQQEETMRQNLEELQATQEEAAKNEEAALGFVNSVNHTIIRADYSIDGKILYANVKLLEKMGYTFAEVEGRSFAMFVQDKDMPDFEASWRKLVEGGKHYEQEVEYKTKTGKIWLLATYTPVRDRSGRVVKILYLAIDITNEKKRSLEYINEIKALESAVVKCDYLTDGKIVFENEVYQRIMGQTHQELRNRLVFDNQKDTDKEAFVAMWNQVVNGIPVVLEEKVVTRSGEGKWLKGTYTPVKDAEGRIYKVIYIGNEITEQKRLEEETTRRNQALQENQEMIRQKMTELQNAHEEMMSKEKQMQGLIQAIESVTYPIELDLEGNIVSVNEKYAALFGLEPKDLIGRSDQAMSLMGQTEAGFVYENFWKEIRFGLAKRKVSQINLNGRELWMSESYTPLFDKDGQLFRIMKLSADISQSKQLELEAKKQANILAQQEAELRNNLEELRATQDEMQRLKAEEERRNKEMMTAMENNRKLLIKVLNNLPAKVFLKDCQSRLVLLNEQVAQQYQRTVDELIGLSDFDMYDHELARQFREKEVHIMKHGAETYLQEDLEGDQKYIYQTTKMPFYIDYLGETGILGIQLDVTDIKKLESEVRKQNQELVSREEELRQNLEELKATQEDLQRKSNEQEVLQVELSKEKALLDALLATIPDHIYFKDRNSCFIRMSDSLVAKFGVASQKELIGKSDFDFFAKDLAEQKFVDEQKIITTGQGFINYIEDSSIGDKISWVSSTKMPLKNRKGEIIGLFGISRDITDLKLLEMELKTQNETLQATEEEIRQNLEELQATQEELVRINAEQEKTQQELAKEKALLDALLNNIPDYIYFKDRDSRFIRISQSMVPLFNAKSPAELIGKSDFDFHSAQHAEHAFNEEQRIIRTGIPIIDQEVKETWDDGREHWMSTTKMPLVDQEGNVVGTFGISKDITELKRTQIETARQNEALQATEEELRQNLEELKATQEELERKNLEQLAVQEALTKEKALLDALLNNIPDFIYFKDRESKFIRISQSMVGLFKAESPEELIGKSDYDFHQKTHADKAYSEEQRIMTSGVPMIDEVVHESFDDGREQWVSTTKMPLKDKEGRVMGVFGISKNVTEMMRLQIDAQYKAEQLASSEEELRQNLEELQAIQDDLKSKNSELMRLQGSLSQEKYLLDALLNNIPDAIYFKDKESRFIRLSQSMAHLFGVESVSQVIGKTDFDFFAGEHARQAFNDEQNIIRTGQPVRDLVERETWEDRDDTWVSTTKMPLYDQQGNIVGTFGISRDITPIKTLEIETLRKNQELVATEEELRQNLEELKAIQDELQRLKNVENQKNQQLTQLVERNNKMFVRLLNNLPAKITLKDKEGHILLINDEAARIYGKLPEELLGISEDTLLDGLELKSLKNRDKEAFKAGRTSYLDEIEIGGRKMLLQTIKQPFSYIDTEGNEHSGLLSIQNDITELQECREAVGMVHTLNEVFNRLETRILLLDGNQKAIFCNRNFAGDMSVASGKQLSTSDIVGTTPREWLTGVQASRFADLHKKVLTSGLADRALEQLTNSDTLLDHTCAPIFLESLRQQGTLSIQYDVTEKEKLRKQVNRLSSTMQAAREKIRQLMKK